MQLNQQVAALNFEKLKWKLTQSAEATWNTELCDFAELEYRKFLSLKKWYPKLSLVPSKLVDKFWHEHILDTRSYMDDCECLFGFYLHHYPYFGIYGDKDQSKLQSSFDETVTVYEEHFGAFPTAELYSKKSAQMARCEEHACHVPTSCACRVPGACK
ncbi:hypothetical protein H5187_20775 [Pseudoalteromonas sp. SG44-1]|nr:hypothetical protein [Pseudoalteromonas sp. SG44-1]